VVRVGLIDEEELTLPGRRLAPASLELDDARVAVQV